MSFTNRFWASFYSDFFTMVGNKISETDNALNEATSRKFQASGTAKLWGKVIPYTYGKRRITGQPLQAGIMRQKLTVDYVTNRIGSGTIEIRSYAQTKRTATFAYVFGAPGNPSSVQLLQRLWLNGVKIYDATTGERQPGLSFGFFQGGEGQVPDATLNQQRYDFPVAYRGLMYVVFYDYVLLAGDPTIQFANSSGSFNPTVEAEFWEQTTNPVTVVPFNDGSGAPASANFGIGVGLDSRKGLYYSIDEDDTIWCFDLATGDFVSRVTMTGFDGAQFFSTYNRPAAFFIEAGVPYFVTQGSLSNSSRLYQINADTGQVTSAVGVDSGSLTPGPNNIITLNSIAVQRVGGKYQVFAKAVTGGHTYLFETLGGQLTLLDIPGTGIPNNVQNGPFYLINEGWKVLSGNIIYNDDATIYYTGTYEIAAVFQTGAFDDLIVFEYTVSGPAWRIYRMTRAFAIVWEYNNVTHPSLPFSVGGGVQLWREKSNTQGQFIAWIVSTTVYRLDMLAGTIEAIPGRAPLSMNSFVYDDYLRTAIQGAGSVLDSNPIFNGQTGNITLESLLRDLARRQGYASMDVTVTGIDDTIVGAAITQVTNISTLLEDISRAYNFQIVKRGKKILFTRRVFGGSFSPDGLISEANRVILSEEEGAYVTVKTSRQDPSQAPGTVVINFIDPDLKYIVNTVEHARNDSQANLSQKLTLNLPIIMDASTAATIAARVVVNATEGRMQHEFLLPQAYSRVEPGDYYELELPEYTDVVKLTEISFNADHSILCKADAASTQIGPAIEMNDYVLEDDSPSLFDEFSPIVINSPLLDYLDQADANVLETYVSLVPAARSPVGAGRVSRGTIIDDLQTVGSTSAILLLGRLSDIPDELNEGQPWQYEELATFNATFSQGDFNLLIDESYEDMLAGANRLLVGQPGRWEFIGFTGVVFDSDTRVATFTGLVRGLRGTDLNVNNHVRGDFVIFYDLETRVLDTGVSATLLGDELFYAGVNEFGKYLYEDVVIVEADGNARKPWAVSNVRAEDTAGDVTITWTRRTRLLGPLVDSTGDVPLDETTEAYELDIYLGGSIVRAVTGVTSETFVYTAAQQSADGQPSPMLTIRVDVYQISSLVGRGFVKAGTYDVE